MATSTDNETTAVCVRSLHLMAEGSREDFEQIYHAEAVNREAASEPPPARVPGPAGFWATAQWLRSAFSGLRFEVHQAVSQDDLVVVHVTMSARHTGPFANYRPGTADVDTAMPPTGREFAVTQTHWFRTTGGLVREHWANRDDLTMARQAGWVPPSPAFLLRAAAAKRRARRTTWR